ncbi:energy-coupled thiamine transporter ThiT [Clostridium thermosuccinogenes]|uniref:Energy-coupled thiamine transporter ThiT n=1 Tax=Clostridium thermosuccinogenes TaxID=84032 RepID=A0A2K2F148_9CLOT|nr:energy-coupled thiamine transporter ThiT [Pseudoclostridium thermosuccinogenes]AUS96829.1 energy-coupled thiamine transporter ThiT [Pseudoclostridium thermosuccinogenes]PNT92504.1 energy-coupled thiamine transporter ThiT [Pseudoclostridium thermosuccinogenes]PNT97020.1 energy-coupled thiamine transporter ThiT [Pseudoclostridium thermosuccinogenes]PNT98879.1 energy-coupled thiamine transporter ThiT [Pseudoclostridium thermosuccinogenes]
MFKIVIQEEILELLNAKSIATIVTLAALAIILVVISKRTAYNTKTLAYGAVAVAAAFLLSYIKLFELPTGGTITIASMLPIFVFSYIYGPRAGILAGLVYGILQLVQGAYVVHWAQMLLDYPIAFAVLGLAGLFKRNIYLGAAVGGTARFISHFLTGVIFFGEFAPEGQSVWLYSLTYNLSYMLPDTLICIGLLLIPSLKAAINRIRKEATA